MIKSIIFLTKGSKKYVKIKNIKISIIFCIFINMKLNYYDWLMESSKKFI